MSSQVRSLNPFALLGDDGDESPAPVAKAPAAAAAPAAKAAPAPKAQAGARGGARRPQVNSVAEPAVDGGDVPKFGRDRPSGRGGSGSRGGRGGRTGTAAARSNGGTYLGGDKPRRENGGGRFFDRHSQTGHKDSEKATAQGWGADEGKTELKAEVEGEQDAKADEAAATAEGAATPRIVEEEDNSQTYEEYLAAQLAAKAKIGGELPEARKANEGVDESQWANQTLKVRKGEEEEESLFAVKTKAQKAKKERAQKQTLEANFSFAAPSRPERDGERAGRGRGGPRGGRGRGARGGARGGAAAAPRGASRAQTQAPALEDSAAFPSLA